MRSSRVVTVGLIGFAALACGHGPGEPQLPTQPPSVATQPPPEPPPPPPPGAHGIELGSAIRDELRNSPLPNGCPDSSDPKIPLPCRHFEVAAPGDGILRVELDWLPQPGAEYVMLIIAGVNNPPATCCVNPQIGWHRVLAGATYGITVAYLPSHFDFIVLGPDRFGEFTLKATFER